MIESYFDTLCQHLPSVSLDWKTVKRAYADRAYHNLTHLEEMLTHLDRHGAQTIRDPAIFAMALVYHDIVYKPTRKDNEARSAEAADKVLRQADTPLPADRIERCSELIMATRAHLPSPTDDGDEALLIDLDLAVLAREPEAYKTYAAAVRREYWMIPGFVYRDGRKKALTSLLDREHLYHTELGREHYEPQARTNLWQELRQL